MTALQNDERFCRKSTVYNQTGQTYFQQLSAYNHMSAHLRRVLLAPSIVDSRNKRYLRNKGLGSGRFSSRSKSLDKIRTQEDIIDGVAYDTQHHPLDVLRKSLECSPESHREVKEIGDACGRCNNWSARSRAGSTSCTIGHRKPIYSETGKTICQCLRLEPCKPCSTLTLKRASPKSSRLNRSCRREWKRSASDRSQTIKAPPSSTINVERSEKSYSYDSSFESSSDNSTASGSPRLKMSQGTPESPDDVAKRERSDKNSETAERIDEAKYAKFIYDITQEITINGLYTDEDLHMIFKKHIDMNFDTLDGNRMLSEIHRLKMALNVRGSSDDEEFTDIERFASTGKFAKFSLGKMQTQSKMINEYNVDEKMRHNDASIRFGEPHRPKSSHGKSTVVLVDPTPQLLITEQDVILTLKEMKLDPRQIQTICKSLQKKNRQSAPSQSVKKYTETSSFKRGQIRSHSPTIDVHHSYTDRKLQNVTASPKKNEPWQCRRTDSPINEASHSNVEPEIEIKPSQSRSQGDEINIAFANNKDMKGISEPSISTRSARSTEPRNIYGASENNENKVMEKNINPASLLRSKKLLQQSLTTLVRLVSNKSLENGNENDKNKEKGKLAKIQAERTSENESPVESAENQTDEEQEKTFNMKMRTNSPSTVQNGDRISHDSKSLADLKLESNNDVIEKAPKTRDSHNYSPPNEEADIMFVSHSRFLANLRKSDVSSLPDISERSEGITEEIAADEPMNNSHEITTVQLSQFEDETDKKMVNFTKPTSQGYVVSVDNRYDCTKKLSPSSILQVSGESENDEDSDENKQVVVAALKTSNLIPKIVLPTSNSVVDKTEANVADETSLSPDSGDLSPRISENDDCKSSNDDANSNNSAREKHSDKSYSLKVEQRDSISNIVNKSSDTETIETELDQQETLHSTSEIQVEEKTFRAPKGEKNSTAKNEDEESRKLYELVKQSDRNSMKIHEISKNKFEVYRPEKDSSRLERKLQHNKSENPKKQKEKQPKFFVTDSEIPQNRYTRFSRLIGKGNCRRDFGLEGTSETTRKKLRISEKNEDQQRPIFPNEAMTTASDISFLRKQILNESAQLSIKMSLNPLDRQSKPTPSNSREIEEYIAKSRSLGNSYTSMVSKQESTSRNSKPRLKTADRHEDVNQNENSIGKRMKAAVGNLIKRSSKSTQMDEPNKKLTRNVSSETTESPTSDKQSPRPEAPETVNSSSLAINSQNSSCICVLTTKKVQRSKTGHCRPDCRGRGFVCDQRCTLFNRILQ